ncbi:hypothetical protein MMC13_001832 [Lambiella insularis]|nr:hypothetical protein [Lambiella insularis]
MPEMPAKTLHGTIWASVSENRFLQNIDNLLETSGERPLPLQVFDKDLLDRTHLKASLYKLPLGAEDQLVNDLAFIAAWDAGAQAVCAVTVLEDAGETPTTIIISANEGVTKDVKTTLERICAGLQQVNRRAISKNRGSELLLDIVVRLNVQRILGRLGSQHWRPHNSSLSKRHPESPFCKTFHRLVGKILSSKHRDASEVSHIIKKAQQLQKTMDDLKGDHDIDGLKQVVKVSYQLSGPNLSLAQRLNDAGIVNPHEKLVKTVDKLGRYWASCKAMAKMASEDMYGDVFRTVDLKALDSYPTRRLLGRKRHVHAEVQMVLHHRLYPLNPGPRVIGISKATCYLCNLFLSYHGQYLVSATHGTIYEKWNIPDLQTYNDETRRVLSGIVAAMNNVVVAQAKRKRKVGFPAPAQSAIWYDRYYLLVSPADSFITNISQVNAKCIKKSSIVANERNEVILLPEEPELTSFSSNNLIAERHPESPSCLNTANPLDRMKTLDSLSTRSPKPEDLPVHRGSGPGAVLKFEIGSMPVTLSSVSSQSQMCNQSQAMPLTTPVQYNHIIENLNSGETRWLQVSNINFCFEMEDTCGTISIRNLCEDVRPKLERVLDVNAMAPNAITFLKTLELSDSLSFVVSNGNQSEVEVVCQWGKQ